MLVHTWRPAHKQLPDFFFNSVCVCARARARSSRGSNALWPLRAPVSTDKLTQALTRIHNLNLEGKEKSLKARCGDTYLATSMCGRKQRHSGSQRSLGCIASLKKASHTQNYKIRLKEIVSYPRRISYIVTHLDIPKATRVIHFLWFCGLWSNPTLGTISRN